MNKSIVTVSPKFQVVIPQAIRESAGIKVGAKMMVVNLGEVIRLLPVKAAADYRGIARGIDTTVPREPIASDGHPAWARRTRGAGLLLLAGALC